MRHIGEPITTLALAKPTVDPLSKRAKAQEASVAALAYLQERVGSVSSISI